MNRLEDELERYLTIRRSLGYDLRTTADVLGALCATAGGASWALGNVLQRRAAYSIDAVRLVAWQQLRDAGYGLTSGPAGAFFYVLTGVHGLHLIGGLGVWLKSVARMRTRAVELIEMRLSIELCTVYWHYLLLVWLVMFALLLST